MKPSAEELEALREDALESGDFRAAMRASAESVERWESTHGVGLAALARAIAGLTRLFRQLEPDPEPTRGDRFPLL